MYPPRSDRWAHSRRSLHRDREAILGGVAHELAGAYQSQLRAAATLRVLLPVALFVNFLISYLQFRSVITTGIGFEG